MWINMEEVGSVRSAVYLQKSMIFSGMGLGLPPLTCH